MPEREMPGNFNALYSRGAKLARGLTLGAAQPAVEPPDLGADVTIHYDEATRNPIHLAVNQPAARLSSAGAASPEEAVRQFVADRAELWQLTPDDIATVEVISVSKQGLPTVRLMQKVGGVEVFQSDLTAAVTPENHLVSLTGQLFSAASSEGIGVAARTRAHVGLAAPSGGISAEEAIAKAARDLTGHSYAAEEFRASSARAETGPYRFYDAPGGEPASDQNVEARRPGFERPVRLKDVLFSLGEGQFVPGYFMELWLQGYPAYSYVIDAVGEHDILFRKNLTSRVRFTYAVHNTGDPLFRPEDGPAPGTPHPTGRPNGFQATPVRERLINIESLLPNRPWLPPNATTTRGNNCIAYADLQGSNRPGPGNVDGQITAALTFGHFYNHGLAATDPTNLQNSLVGMFFHVNWLHDRWYAAGFDEASGNAQDNNFGLGGLGGDPILAEGNDASGHDNANMSTPADGASPRIQMYRFDGPQPLPSRTSNHEALITFHEMGHYITNRLVGNASGLANTQGLALGEGWGDFFAICMTSQAPDNFASGAFAAGGWTDITSTFKENYYFSIRRYPYSADMAKNPLTFRHIGANVALPVGPPRNPTAQGPNNEVHNAGEVWCTMLWEVFVNLVADCGHVEAERRMLEYVIGGLKVTPSNPTFLQARDAILAAAMTLHSSDLPLIWKGFAKRGMGRGAQGPVAGSTSLTGVVESYMP